MSGRFAKHLEIAVNIALLCAFLAVAAVAVKRFWPTQPARLRPTIGTKLSIDGIDWGASRGNLVLVLGVGCHYCSESAEFYKRLLPAASSAGRAVFAVLPQPVSESRAYLSGLGLSIEAVHQSPLHSVDTGGTPTLLLVDGSGHIEKAWVGKLSREREQQVLASLR